MIPVSCFEFGEFKCEFFYPKSPEPSYTVVYRRAATLLFRRWHRIGRFEPDQIWGLAQIVNSASIQLDRMAEGLAEKQESSNDRNVNDPTSDSAAERQMS